MVIYGMGTDAQRGGGICSWGRQNPSGKDHEQNGAYVDVIPALRRGFHQKALQ